MGRSSLVCHVVFASNSLAKGARFHDGVQDHVTIKTGADLRSLVSRETRERSASFGASCGRTSPSRGRSCAPESSCSRRKTSTTA